MQFMVRCWPQLQGRWLGETPFVPVSKTWVLTCQEMVHQMKEIETWLSDSRVGNNSVAGHKSWQSVCSPLHNCVDRCLTILGVEMQAMEMDAQRHQYTNTHTHTHFMALFPELPGWAGTRKVKPIWILPKQEAVSGRWISWAICKSAPRSRQITTPAPNHSVFYRPDALPAAQPTASKHWRDISIQNTYTFTMCNKRQKMTCRHWETQGTGREGRW